MRQLDEKSCFHARLKYYDFFMVMSAIAAVCGNFLALKVTQIGPLTFGASVIFFPVSYVLGDLITEVYGFYRARRVMWVGLAAMLFAAIMSSIVLALPAAPGEHSTEIAKHYAAVFSVIPRIFLASILAFIVGTYVNDVVMSKRKIRDEGRGFWKRAILSTALGQAADSLVFYPLAFGGVWPWHQIWAVMATHFCVKVGLEIVGVPFTSYIVAFVKRAEGLDHFDRGIDYNPFGLSVQQNPGGETTPMTPSPTTPVAYASSQPECDVRNKVSMQPPGSIVKISISPSSIAMSTQHFDRVFAILDQHLWAVTSRSGLARGGLIATLVRKVSLTPEYPRILLGLAKHHHTFRLVNESKVFACHLFTERQIDWVSRFGTKSGRGFDKLAGQRVATRVTGSPILEDALAWLDCRVQAELDVGDRIIYVAQVVDASLNHDGAAPLTFNRLMQIAPDELRAQLAEGVKADCLIDEKAVREWLDAKGVVS